ncbi:protein-tyrosine-phosphatase [Caerostris extrusa]|uniref:Protein-tyrosine-phosphatase n=1 Tax=Caerostris extrusa TaxID=172846 RepID=A0AAV4VIZ1_CAEEX|nr:protein-tyrosine-phosphatase [Caerostris extrusa]
MIQFSLKSKATRNRTLAKYGIIVVFVINGLNLRQKKYRTRIRVGEMGEWESAMGIMTPDNKTSYHVIGLQPYTVYSFRVRAVNAIGASEPSKESYYMVTLREVPDGKTNYYKCQYTIRNLDIFTQYLISVQVFNPAGHGPAATVAVMTDEGTPSKPLNLIIGKVGDSSVRPLARTRISKWHYSRV